MISHIQCVLKLHLKAISLYEMPALSMRSTKELQLFFFGGGRLPRPLIGVWLIHRHRFVSLEPLDANTWRVTASSSPSAFSPANRAVFTVARSRRRATT